MVACYTLLLHQNSFDQITHEYDTTAVVVDHSATAVSVWARDDVKAVLHFFVLSRYASGAFAGVMFACVPALRRDLLALFKPAPHQVIQDPPHLELERVPVHSSSQVNSRAAAQRAVSDSGAVDHASSTAPAAKTVQSHSWFQSLFSFAFPDLRLHTPISIKVLGDFFSLTGLIVDSVAYALYYEPSVVNATEGGLQQLLNLFFAVVFSRVCRFGRPVRHLPVKIVSFVMVSLGLLLSST